MKKVVCLLVALILALSAMAAFAEYTPMEKGAKGDDVKKLQERLKELGFLSGKVDGSYGNGTAAAVKAFEDFNGLEETGVASAELQEFLFSDNAKGVPVPDVEISELKLPKGSVNNPQLTLINQTEDTIDSVSYLIKVYNAYGERMGNEPLKLSDAMWDYYKKDYGTYYEYSAGDLSNIKIKPNGKLTIKGYNGVNIGFVSSNSIALVKMAIVRYHTTDGKIVVIPENEQVWKGTDGSVEVIEYENNLYELPELTAEMEETAESFKLGIGDHEICNFFAEVAGMPYGGDYIEYIEEGSIAEAAGLKASDVIAKIGDVWVMSKESVSIAKALMSDDEPTPVIYYRKGEMRTTEFEK